MAREVYSDLAKKLDMAHEKRSEHARKTLNGPKKHSYSRGVRMVLLFTVIIGVIVYFGSYFFVSSPVIDEPVVPPITIEPPQEVPALQVIGSQSSADTGRIVSTQTNLIPTLQIQGAIDAFNLTQQSLQSQPIRPLAFNFVHGATDGALSALLTSLGFAEIESQLLGSDAALGGVEAATNLGQPIKNPVTLEAKTALMQRIDNVLALDAYAVMDLSFNRQAQYDKYVTELNNLSHISQKVSQDINSELASLSTQVSALQTDKTRLEGIINEGTDALVTQGLEQSLNDFNRVSSQLITAQSRVRILQKLRALFDIRLTSLTLRIEGVQKNRDALIKDVRVTPVSGSGVDLTAE
jgi:hypothetical protein